MRSRAFLLPLSLLAACSNGDDAPIAATDSSAIDSEVVDARASDSRAVIDSTAVDTATVETTTNDSADVLADAHRSCGDHDCLGGQICTRTYTTGGTCFPCGDDDADSCPAGRHCSGACCVEDAPSFTYACKPIPTACGDDLTCASCGAASCSGSCPCEDVSAGVVTCRCAGR